MTVAEIRNMMSKRGKPVSRETLYTYFRRFKIKPLGARQVPQRYADNVPDKICKRLGIKITLKTSGHTNGKASR